MLLALATNIGLGWKVLERTNILAYYKHSLVTDVKSFITLGHGSKTARNNWVERKRINSGNANSQDTIR